MRSITIIGAGIAGPVAALRLAQSGYQCTVFERASSPQTIGGAINLAPNGLRLLDRLGVLQKILRHGCKVDSFEMRNERGGILGYFPNSSTDGYVGVRIMRAELQRILLGELAQRGMQVVFQSVLESVSEQGGKVIAKFSNGTTAEADFLVGADGIHSTVRKYVLHPQEISPQYTGTALVYGILDTNNLPTEVVSSMHVMLGVFGRKGFFAAAFCDSQRSRLYWISAVEKPIAEKLDDPVQIKAQELSKFGHFYTPIPEIIVQTTEFFSWPIYELPVLDHWSRGKVVLVGDAAHAIPPDKGQGVSQAIEDIFILARIWDSGKELSRYQELRQPRVEKLRETMKLERRDRERGPWAALLRDWVFWVFLKVVNLLGSWWSDKTFGYDPDVVGI